MFPVTFTGDDPRRGMLSADQIKNLFHERGWHKDFYRGLCDEAEAAGRIVASRGQGRGRAAADSRWPRSAGGRADDPRQVRRHAEELAGRARVHADRLGAFVSEGRESRCCWPCSPG